jgi:hypothetical protein
VVALTPVAAMMFRFNNPDALLALLLVIAAYATVRGAREGTDLVAGPRRALRRVRVHHQNAAGLPHHPGMAIVYLSPAPRAGGVGSGSC